MRELPHRNRNKHTTVKVKVWTQENLPEITKRNPGFRTEERVERGVLSERMRMRRRLQAPGDDPCPLPGDLLTPGPPPRPHPPALQLPQRDSNVVTL